MLLRILVVDDESYIADSTAMLLRESLEGETDVRAFTDAEEALRHMRCVKTDVLVTDIRMPGMDGMELLRETRALWPGCEIILLTAHSEFDYAYQAIKQSRVDYVLKHEGFDAIREAVKRAIERIENANGRESILRKAKEQADAALPWLQREYILELLSGTVAADPEQARRLSLPVDLSNPLFMMLAYVHDAADGEDLFEREKRSAAIRAAASMMLPDEDCLLQLPVDADKLLWLWQPRTPRPEQLDGLLEAVQDGVAYQTDLSVSFAYMTRLLLPSEYPAAYDRLDATTSVQATGCMRMWLVCADGEIGRVRQAALVTGKSLEKQLLNSIASCRTVHDLDYMRLYIAAAMPLVRLAENMNLTAEQLTELNVQKLYNLSAHATPVQAAAYLCQTEARLHAFGRRNAEESTDSLIRNLRAYIASHLADDISLTALADQVHLNASYLSRIFKQRTGENLNDYIRAARLKKACELLRQPEVKIYEIGAQLGFATPAYFSFFFKKEMSMTPKEYREQAGLR